MSMLHNQHFAIAISLAMLVHALLAWMPFDFSAPLAPKTEFGIIVTLEPKTLPRSATEAPVLVTKTVAAQVSSVAVKSVAVKSVAVKSVTVKSVAVRTAPAKTEPPEFNNSINSAAAPVKLSKPMNPLPENGAGQKTGSEPVADSSIVAPNGTDVSSKPELKSTTKRHPEEIGRTDLAETETVRSDQYALQETTSPVSPGLAPALASPERSQEVNGESSEDDSVARQTAVHRANRPLRPLADNPKPHYPRSAHRLGHEGKTIIRVEVLANGQVASANILRSSGSKFLDEAALKTARLWRFQPAERSGLAVSASLDIPFLFELQNRG